MIYVDDMWKTAYGRFRGMQMSHMIADTLEELHEFADKLGLKREWFQDKISGPHYDISLGKRRLAVIYGAKQITLRQCAAICWCQRNNLNYTSPWGALTTMLLHYTAELRGDDDGTAKGEAEAEGTAKSNGKTSRKSRSIYRHRLPNGKLQLVPLADPTCWRSFGRTGPKEHTRKHLKRLGSST